MLWKHHTSHAYYRILMFTNESTKDGDKYPITVVYQNVHNNKIWSRPLSDWDRSFEPSEDTELTLVDAKKLVDKHGLEQSKRIVSKAPRDDIYYSTKIGDSGVRDRTVYIAHLKQAVEMMPDEDT